MRWLGIHKLVIREIDSVRKPCSLDAEQINRIIRTVKGSKMLTMMLLEERERFSLRKITRSQRYLAEAHKIVFHHRSDLLLGTFNACLKDSIFLPLRSGKTSMD